MSTLSVFAFQNETEANRVVDELKRLQGQHLIQVEDAALVTRDQNGKTRMKQVQTLVGIGALGGAFWGFLVGLLFEEPFIGMAVGAGLGALGAGRGTSGGRMGTLGIKMTDLGISEDFVKQMSHQIQPGQAALFLLTREEVMDKVIPALKKYPFQILHTSLSQEDESRFREALGTR